MACHRDDLKQMSGTGRIDLVWGDDSFGLKHILDKHEAEFKDIGKEISEIVENGKLVSKNGVDTRWHKIDDKLFKLGLGKGFKGQGDNHWVITAYEVTREKDKTFGDALFADKQPLSNPNAEKSPRSDFLPSSEINKGDGTNLRPSDLNDIIPQKNNQSQILDMNDDSAFKTIKC